MKDSQKERRNLDRHPAAGLQMTVSAELASVDEVVENLAGFLRAQGLGLYLHDLCLLAREALNNAVLHGCGESSCKRVMFKARRAGDHFELAVSDAGRGFVWSKADFDPPGSCEDCGRGLPIMAQYADHVFFNETGNEIVLVKSLLSCAVPLIEMFEEQGGLLLRPTGDVTASVVSVLKERIIERLGDASRSLTIDCSLVGMVDSVGLGLFINLHNLLAAQGGRLRLLGVSGELGSLLTSMRLDRHFEVLAPVLPENGDREETRADPPDVIEAPAAPDVLPAVAGPSALQVAEHPLPATLAPGKGPLEAAGAATREAAPDAEPVPEPADAGAGAGT